VYSLCQLTHDVRESPSAHRTLRDQPSIVQLQLGKLVSWESRRSFAISIDNVHLNVTITFK